MNTIGVLKSFTKFLVEHGIAKEGMNAETLATDFLREHKDMENPIKYGLMVLPQRIVTEEKTLFLRLKDLTELSTKAKQTELNTLLAVQNEKDKEGKTKFSNDVKRKAETDRKLKENKEYQANQERINNLTESIENKKIGLAHLKRLFRAAESIAILGREK